MKTSRESRHCIRFPFHKAVSVEIWRGREERLQEEGIGIDLSSEGGGLATSFPLKKGDVVRLLIPMGKMQLRLPVYALVAWSRAADGGFRSGVAFLA